jgi:Na+:H+ antiporter, NhaA family
MAQAEIRNRLDRPVERSRDHVLGPDDAQITLVEYGSYACPHCRAANEPIAAVRDHFGERLRYVFRHRPLTGSDIARRAAELAECAASEDQFWTAHIELMTRSEELTEGDLGAVSRDLGLQGDDPVQAESLRQRARERVQDDEASARTSGVSFTPTFFINGRRYDGPWDEVSLSDAMLNTLGHRARTAALDFARWGPSAGVLLLLASLLAIALTNSPVGADFQRFWQHESGLMIGDAVFRMSLLHWVNDGLLTVFFLVVGLEIKREFTVGHLAGRKSAALPIAAALGGMAVPAALYALLIPSGPWAAGWGVPMATDTAFAIALIAMLGRRVPVELRIFLTAAAIVDDIGGIVVVAIFYSGAMHAAYLTAAAITVLALALLNRARVYRVFPYMALGLTLWYFVYAGGLNPTLAGVLLALFIPTRPPANLRSLTMQAQSIIAAETLHSGDVLRHGPSQAAMEALDAIHDRIESPADRLLRRAGARSSYVVLPIFALANAGVLLSLDALDTHASLLAAIGAALVVGKPLGILAGAGLAVAAGVASKPTAYSWRQLAGAGAMAGIGFTMSLFIAGQAFAVDADFTAAKIAVFAASIVAAIIGTVVLWSSPPE